MKIRTLIGAAALPAGVLILMANPAQAGPNDIPCPDGSTVPIGSFCPLFTIPTVTSTVVTTTYVTTTVPGPPTTVYLQRPDCGPPIN